MKINKTVSLFLLISLFSVSMSAKEEFGTEIGIGLKGGLNFNKVIINKWDNNFFTDPIAGLFVFANRSRIGVQIEANWSQNSLTIDSTFYGFYHQYYNQLSDSLKKGSFTFKTISIPLLVNIKLASFLWLQGGPQYSASISSIDEQEIIRGGVDILKKNNFNIVGGLWFQLGKRIAPIKFNAGVRYVSGINSMSNIETITGEKSEWKNRMIQVHAGFNF